MNKRCKNKILPYLETPFQANRHCYKFCHRKSIAFLQSQDGKEWTVGSFLSLLEQKSLDPHRIRTTYLNHIHYGWQYEWT